MQQHVDVLYCISALFVQHDAFVPLLCLGSVFLPVIKYAGFRATLPW